MSLSWFGFGSAEKKDNREFEVVIYEEDYKELCAWVLRKPHIETGGDLFGLWADEYNAVIQFALGPGKRCRRTTASFYQDVKYLDEVGSYLTQNEGVCHIGEWHSHHQLGLARPSGGDENTVWNNMPTYNLTRFVIFIANIEASQQYYNVNIGCFLFEIDNDGKRLPVIPGKFKILHGENPFSRKKEVNGKRSNGEEDKRGDEFNVNIKDLLLMEEKGKNSPSVTMKRPRRMPDRKFEVVIYEEDYKEMCAWVLRKPHIETGGDLFGLWADKYNAVIQLALGPGERCRRTSVSFYQDVKYLEEVGSYLTQNEGVCHIGEWHSHHQLGLARPSGGDENTVWNNMPTYNLTRFVIFIANIEASHQYYNVNIGCFLFEIDSDGERLPVIPGKFKILHGENPFSRKKEVNGKRSNGEEEKSGDEFDIDIKDLLLKEEKGKKSPSVTMRRPETKKRNQREDEKRNQPQPKRNRGQPPPKGTTKPQFNQSDQEDSDTSDKREGSEGQPGRPTTDEAEVTGQKKEKGEDRGENESTEEEENVEVRKDKKEEMKQPQEKRKEEGMETDDPENQRNDEEMENEEDNSKRDDDLKKLEVPALTVKGDDKQGSDEMAGSAAGKTETGDHSKATEIQNVGDKQGPAGSAEFVAGKTNTQDQSKNTEKGDEQGPAGSAESDSKKTKKEDQTKITEVDDTQSPAGSAESVADNTKKEGDKQGPAKLAPGEMNTEAQSENKGSGDKPGPAGSAESVAEKTEKEDQTETKEIDDKQGSAGLAKLVAGETNTEDQSKTKEIGHKQSPAGSVAEKTKKEDQTKTKEIGDKQRQAKSADSTAEKMKIEDETKTTGKGVKQGSTASAARKMKIEVQSKITGKGSAGSAGPTVSAASGKTKREIQTKTTDKKFAPQNGKGGSKRPGGARKTK